MMTKIMQLVGDSQPIRLVFLAACLLVINGNHFKISFLSQWMGVETPLNPLTPFNLPAARCA